MHGGGGGPAEPVLQLESVLTDKVNFNCHAELVSASVPCRKLPVTLDRSRNKFGMTLQKITMSCGFTMAEILLSLTIIGVVAAITLPSLTGNINERTWNTQRKALYARFSQAIPLMDAINGYGTLQEMTDSATGSTSIEDTAAETFITGGLSKVMKINNICDYKHLSDCGISSKITTLGGVTIDVASDLSAFNSDMTSARSNEFDSVSLINTKAAAFETGNGESVLLYYNPRCVGSLAEAPWGGSSGYYVHNKVCANFVYDLNGNKGPNTVGKDIGFMTAMYPSDVKVAAPYPMVNPPTGTYQYNATDPSQSGAKICSTLDSEYRLPNTEEAISLFVNKELLQSSSNKLNGIYWTSSRIYNYTASSVPHMWIFTEHGVLDDHKQSESWKVWCVKR